MKAGDHSLGGADLIVKTAPIWGVTHANMVMRKILITGASSGLGAALARNYARNDASGGVELVLWGRDQTRLDAVAVECRALGAACHSDAFDLRDVDGMLARLASLGRVELAIFCAGVGGSVPDSQASESAAAARVTAEVNFVGPVAGASAMAEAMAERGRGQIVLVGSIAESFPLPMAPSYAASKAGLALFAEALGIRMARHGVTVSLVSPGFIDTPMSQGLTQPKPFLMSADHAAAIIARAIARGQKRIVVPWQFIGLRGFAMMLPRAWLRAILGRL